ncbi:uncharacterized protein LOC126772832 [Nymphalis io]|uniref:uncharacterized protein LOC126772832 n=1 Tax=Inachis io TaxID=171585 RepID=UPI002168DC64|nr:uncharacterized protein LOC126772832 [Nymphalis io]
MFYKSDFAVQYYDKKLFFVNRNAFTVTSNNNKEDKTINRYSLAYTMKSLSYLSSLFGMSYIKYSKYGIKKVNKFNKIYCLIIIISFITWYVINNIHIMKTGQLVADLPLIIITKTFGVMEIVEIVHNTFITTFKNSAYFLRLIKTIDSIDDHFQRTKKHFIKSRIFAIVMTILPFLFFSLKYLLENYKPWAIMPSFTFTFEMVQSVNCFFYVTVIYSRFLNFNSIFLKKAEGMSSSKKLIFKDNLYAKVIKKMLSDPVQTEFNNGYCWFELMQIYDKISECIYLFNKIYANQILLMFNTWLLSSMLVICRITSPTLQYIGAVKADIYYYFFLSIRPIFVTFMSEKLTDERRKTRMIIEHILIYHDLNPEYRKQMEIMMDLLETRKTHLSANVVPINLDAMLTFAGLILSYAVVLIQIFYLK